MFTIYTAVQRDVESWISNPIIRQEFFSTRELALTEAATWPGYGIGKDIEVVAVDVQELPRKPSPQPPDPRCSETLRQQGKAYPRTCPVHGLWTPCPTV